MITDAEVEKSLDYLRDKASQDAQARAERLYLEHFIKTVLAEQMQRSSGASISAADMEARTSDAYKQALQDFKTAVFNDEKRRFLRAAAAAKIEAYRTQQATLRAEGKLTL